jgi:S-formylglutathione hydrolase FrmB
LAARVIAGPPEFEITFDKAVRAEPYTGRVYIVTTTHARQSPLEGVNWFDTQPFFAQEVETWAPGEVLRFESERCLGYPDDLARLPAGSYRVQAVLDLNGWSHDVLQAPGNGVSDVVKLVHDPERPGKAKLHISRTLPPLRLVDTDDLKYVRLLSDSLTRFYGHYVHMYASVALPEAYERDKTRRFPALYVVPGFGGTIRDENTPQMMRGLLHNAGFEAVVIYLDADCPTGHHVFADSANNGPWGTALVSELIPYLEQRFRLLAETDARYVTGVSSGGWSSLWLQITYPETFGGVWSISPDPVDFSAFQQVDIYDPNENFLWDSRGELRCCSRPMMFGRALVLRDFCRMEEVLGRGGQFQSFDAVFSPRGPDGKPMPLWDRKTGRIDPQVAEAWKKYDIRWILDANWTALGPRLGGKLHLFCGDQDEFFLERAFVRLRDCLKKLGSDAYIEVVPGGGHGLTPDVWLRTVQQMKEQFEERHGARVVWKAAHGSGWQARLASRALESSAACAVRIGAARAAGVRVGLRNGKDAVEHAFDDGVQAGLDPVQRSAAEFLGSGVVAPGTQ